MKVSIDAELCSGHGRCHVLAPDVYTLDDNDGYNALRGKTFDVPAGLEDKAMFGLNACPEAAIEVVDG